MGRPRTPLGKAKLTGALANHPERFRDRTEPKSPSLGKPPLFLEAAESSAWSDFAKEWPWLTESDRAALVPLCILRAKIETRASEAAAVFSEYRLMLSQFGGTPATKTKVPVVRDDDEDDPFAQFEDFH